jgi:hypothetical protein
MDANDLLLQLGQTNPKVGLIAQYLAQRRAEEPESESEADVDADWEYADADDRAGGTPEALDHLRQMAEDMYVELEELRERNDILATALGACYLCWGEDPACEICRGRGRPGASMPNGELFTKLVIPAARRLRRRDTLGGPRYTRRDSLGHSMNHDERRDGKL